MKNKDIRFWVVILVVALVGIMFQVYIVAEGAGNGGFTFSSLKESDIETDLQKQRKALGFEDASLQVLAVGDYYRVFVYERNSNNNGVPLFLIVTYSKNGIFDRYRLNSVGDFEILPVDISINTPEMFYMANITKEDSSVSINVFPLSDLRNPWMPIFVGAGVAVSIYALYKIKTLRKSSNQVDDDQITG